jgi:hypothetical protein
MESPPKITPKSRSSQGLAPIYAGGREMNPLRNRDELAAGSSIDNPGAGIPADPRVNPLAAGQAIPTAGLAARQNSLLSGSVQPGADTLPPLGSGGTVPAEFSSDPAVHPGSLAMPGSLNNAPGGTAPSQTTFEQARRSAALMGLGIGPGQMFSTLEHQANRIAAGSNSQLNGVSFPQPSRDLPDMRTPPDLRQAPSFFQPSEAAPPPNNLGQHMPAAATNLSGPSQWPSGTAGAPIANTAPPVGPSPEVVHNFRRTDTSATNELATYDETRQRVDQTLQYSMNAWANSPAQAIPSPSSGVPFQQPPPPAQQMEAWNRQPVSPEQYPGSAQSRSEAPSGEITTLPNITPRSGRPAAVDPARYVPTTSRSVAPTYREGVVVPQQYQRSR